MQNLMLDLETVGLNYNAPIVSIGAVLFDLEKAKLGAEFYVAVDLTSSAKNSPIDADTVKWWMRQSSEAQVVFNDPNAQKLDNALIKFSEFITNNCDEPSNLKVWGNGSNFDNVILKEAYNSISLETPWSPFNDRDVRTMVSLAEDLTSKNIKSLVIRKGIYHNALDDAKYQAQCVCEAFKLCKGK